VKRLLFLVNEALFFTTHRMPLGEAMLAEGFEVHVAAPFEAPYVELIRSRGFVYHDIPLERGGRSLLGEAKLFAAFLHLLRRVKPDLVHHVAMKPTAFGGAASRLLRVPAVVHAVTGLGFLFVREDWGSRAIRAALLPVWRYALHHPNGRVIFQNPDDMAMFLGRGLAPEGRSLLIRGTGVDLEKFAPRPAREDPPVVMFPARLLGDKGVNEFVAAARRLKAGGANARFVLVGRRDPLNPTDVGEAALQGWLAEGVVEWWGFREDMPETLNRADVICMPSYREGAPRGLIEAAACGLPIVTADVPGCREAVRHGENGLLVPVRDAAAAAEAIGRLLADPDLRRRMGEASRALAAELYSVERFVADTLAVYCAVLPPGALPQRRA
jgi:glycosyltransferase involved in cell wall biosynthesis